MSKSKDIARILNQEITREEALSVINAVEEELSARGDTEMEYKLDRALCVLGVYEQPDPTTGLMPCGCGGKAILEKGINYHSGYYVICEKCECNIGLDRDDFLRPFGAYPTAEQAVSDWNRAIGWKGGAE